MARFIFLFLVFLLIYVPSIQAGNFYTINNSQYHSRKRADLRADLGKTTFRQYGKLRPTMVTQQHSPFNSIPVHNDKVYAIPNLANPPLGRKRSVAVGSSTLPVSMSVSSSASLPVPSKVSSKVVTISVSSSKSPKLSPKISLKPNLLKDDDSWVMVPDRSQLEFKRRITNLVEKAYQTRDKSSQMVFLNKAITEATNYNDKFIVQKLFELRSSLLKRKSSLAYTTIRIKTPVN